jgi:hypothetical protein
MVKTKYVFGTVISPADKCVGMGVNHESANDEDDDVREDVDEPPVPPAFVVSGNASPSAPLEDESNKAWFKKVPLRLWM